MDFGAIIMMSIITLMIIALAVFVVSGKPRYEPNNRIHRGPVALTMISGFIVAYVMFGNFLAAILAASILGAFSIGVVFWYEANLHSECGYLDRNHTASDRKLIEPRNIDPLGGGRGPSAR